MKFSIRFADQIVGVLIILALAILIVVVFMIGKSQRWFVRDLQYVTYLTSANGVRTNMGVQYKGITIGHVKKIALARDDEVEVTFTIFEEYSDRVRYGSLVEVQVSPIGLGNSFIFYSGNGTDLMPEGTVIPEVNSAAGKILISNNQIDMPESTDSIVNIINRINQILADLEMVTGDIGERINPILEGVPNILSNVERITGGIADPDGALMTALERDGSVTTILEDLAGIIGNLEEVSNFIPAQLPQLAVLISDINVTLMQVQDLMTSLLNNPLLKGGVPERIETGPTGAGMRDLEF